MSEPLGIGLIGCGTVGSGVARLLTQESERLATRAGRSLVLRRVAVRDPSKPRAVTLPAEMVTTDIAAVVRDPAIPIVVELVGGTSLARTVVRDALAAGKHVVTANKALLAAHGPEIFAAARQAERTVCFEAAVAGGVPIIRALAESLAANQVTAIQGILNGTSNFILSAMSEKGMSYADALAQAQKLGYAEADPTLDVDGSDAAHKLAILAQIAFGVVAQPAEIERHGIDTIDALDVRYADELGYTVKLLAEAWAAERDSPTPTVALHVAPVLLRKTDMLAQVRGAFNAIQVVGDVVGETLYQGPGAGMMATASSVVADLIDLAVGRAQKTFAVANLWSGGTSRFSVVPSDKVRSRFYLRLLVRDLPGVLADVCQALADQEISISSVIQHEAVEGHPEQVVPLVIMTHTAETARMRDAIATIDRLAAIVTPAVHYSVDD
ncbi:MAG: homoserine dehydrogenase [Bacteroidales bacterium]|nr:homoserine dehydrogenase [Bacteroidales bacterium]